MITYDKEEQEWNRHLKSTDNFYLSIHFILPNASFPRTVSWQWNFFASESPAAPSPVDIRAGRRQGIKQVFLSFSSLKHFSVADFFLQTSAELLEGWAWFCTLRAQWSILFLFFSFFRLPRVISCFGRLSYFQINYFQDSYSPICSEKFHSWPWECSVNSECIFAATVLPWSKGIKKTVFGLPPRNGKWGFHSSHPQLKLVEQLCVKLEW